MLGKNAVYEHLPGLLLTSAGLWDQPVFASTSLVRRMFEGFCTFGASRFRVAAKVDRPRPPGPPLNSRP